MDDLTWLCDKLQLAGCSIEIGLADNSGMVLIQRPEGELCLQIVDGERIREQNFKAAPKAKRVTFPV